MEIVVWGLVPLLIPKTFIPIFGLNLTDFQKTTSSQCALHNSSSFGCS